jgi:TolB-like protein
MRKTAQAFSTSRARAAFTFLAAFALRAAPSVARADVSVMVLGITSMEGDDEFANSLTGAIRHEASQVGEWQVSGREVTLAQMSLAHGCSDTPDVACLRQIATTLNAQRLVYGVVRRDSSQDFHVTLSLYDAETGTIERTVEETLPGSRTDIDDVREPARRMVAQISGPQTGSLSIASNTPGATVRVDGEVAGTTDAEGNFAMPQIPVGEHAIELRADGHEPWTGQVSIARGTEMTLDAQLMEGTGDTGGGGGGPSINWAGIALIAGGAAAFGVSIYAWARLDAINSDPEYDGYLQSFQRVYDPDMGGAAPADRMNNCDAAGRGDMLAGMVSAAQVSTVSGLCSEGNTLEILQYVFLGVAVAAGATGIVLMVLDSGSGETEPQVTLTPSFGPDGGSIGARIRF